MDLARKREHQAIITTWSERKATSTMLTGAKTHTWRNLTTLLQLPLALCQVILTLWGIWEAPGMCHILMWTLQTMVMQDMSLGRIWRTRRRPCAKLISSSQPHTQGHGSNNIPTNPSCVTNQMPMHSSRNAVTKSQVYSIDMWSPWLTSEIETRYRKVPRSSQ